MARLLKRAFALIVVAAIAGAVIYVSLLPAVQRQLTGRRAKLGNGPVPVTIAQAQLRQCADLPRRRRHGQGAQHGDGALAG